MDDYLLIEEADYEAECDARDGARMHGAAAYYHIGRWFCVRCHEELCREAGLCPTDCAGDYA